MKICRALLKFLLFSVLTVIVAILQTLVLLFHKGQYAYVIPKFWQEAVCVIFRIKVEQEGHICRQGQTLFVSNHVSYLDIPVIGSILTASFIAKKDVQSWPVFGFLSKLQQTLFIGRDRKDAEESKRMLDQALSQKKNLILFPEGTSTEGVEVKDFKSSLFSIALNENAKSLFIQPVTLRMIKIDGRCPSNQDQRDLYAWHLNMETSLAAHLWRFAKTKGATIRLVFHPPIQANDFENRKTLAKHCQNAVSNGLIF